MTGHRILQLFFFSLLLTLCAISAEAALPEPAELKRMLDSATCAAYPNADTVTVYDGETVTYQKDGLAVSQNDFCIKALTEAGRRKLRRMRFGFSSDYGTVAVESAEIIRPDGSRRIADLRKNVSVAISSGQMRSNIFTPSHKVLSLVFPELETGDAVLARLKRIDRKTPFPGIFSGCFLLQDYGPVLLAEVAVDAPDTLPLRSVALKDRAGNTVLTHPAEKRGGRTVHRWTARNVPQLIPEPDMPDIRGSAQRLLVGTAEDWAELSRWYYGLCRPRLDAVDDALKAEVERLTAGRKTDAEKAMALFQFVSQKIRYTGVNNETGAPGFEPHDVKDTFRQRHGVCRDKAALLTAMLNLAGLKAYPALFYAGKPPVDAEVPASRFNHAVVAWETAPREYQLMDPTFETTSEFFPAYLANQSYLVARPDGDTLRRSPSPPAERNALRIRTAAGYASDGTLEGTSTLDFTGVNDQLYRSAFSRHSRSVMRQIFARQLKKAIPGAELSRFEVSPSDVRDMGKPLRVVLAYRAEHLLPPAHDAEALPLPELSRHFGAVRFMTGGIDLEKRRHPLLFDATAMVEEEFKLRLPESLRLAGLPRDTAAERDDTGFAWKRELRHENGAIVGRSYTALTRMEVPPEQYAQLRDRLREYIARCSAVPLVQHDFSAASNRELAALFPDADSFLEYDNTSIELASGGGFESVRDSRRRILNYSGVKRHSELKFRYNPKWEKVEIRAVVTSPDGVRHYLEPRNIIDMDAPEVSGAPRYPGAKIKVAVLPGVAVGSVVDTVVTFSCAKPPFFHFALPFDGRVPAAERKLELLAQDKKLRISPTPTGIRRSVLSRGAKTRYRWMGINRPALPDELEQASSDLFAPTVFVSNGDYKKYAARLDAALRKLAEAKSEEVYRIYSSLKGGTMEKTVLNIRDYAATRLRSAGPALNELPIEYLTLPERTFADGYGNSADRAIAVAALLKRADVKYKFVAVSDIPFVADNEKRLKSWPSPVFTAVLVYIPELDIYLNDTDRYASPGTTAHADRIGLDLSDGRLLAVRPRYRKEDEVRTEFRIRLNAGGAADIAVTREFFGGEFNREHRRFAEMTPEERRQHFEKIAAELSPAARLEDSGSYDFSSYPGKIAFRCRIEKFAVSAGEHLQMELPGYSAVARSVGAVEANRRTPVLRRRASRITLRYRIDFPDGYRVVRRRPADLEIGRRNSGYFIEHSAVERNRIVINAKLVLPVELIQPQDYVELVNLQSELDSLSSKRIILKAQTKGRMRR